MKMHQVVELTLAVAVIIIAVTCVFMPNYRTSIYTVVNGYPPCPIGAPDQACIRMHGAFLIVENSCYAIMTKNLTPDHSIYELSYFFRDVPESMMTPELRKCKDMANKARQ